MGSYINEMIKRDKAMRITVGCRCAFKEDTRWTKGKYRDYAPGTHCIIKERDGNDFAVLVLKGGFTGKLEKDLALCNGSVAWVHENELRLVDSDYHTNLAFLDWYQEVKDDICGDCCEHFLNEEGICPGPECPGNDLDYFEEDGLEEL